MYVKSIEIAYKNRTTKLEYVSDNRRLKTLRERVIIINKDVKISHIERCVDINFNNIDNCKIIATLDDGTEINVKNIYDLYLIMHEHDSTTLETFKYGNTVIYVNSSMISIITRLSKPGGYISKATNCISIPGLLNLKNRPYREDYKEWFA